MEKYYDYEGTQNDLIVKSFFYMFLGILLTVVVSAITMSIFTVSGEINMAIFGVVLVLELIVVTVFTVKFKKATKRALITMFVTYAILNGITFSVVFMAYEVTSIILSFVAAALVFGIFAIYGWKTQNDMTNIGTLAVLALIPMIILTIINLFLGSSLLEIGIDIVILILFFGITAWDIQKMKNMSTRDCDKDKWAVYFALQLYLDFVNILLRVLKLVGNRK